MKTSLTEVIRSTQEERHLTISLEIAKWELADAEKELKWLKSAVSSSEKEYEQTQQQITDIEVELESERCVLGVFSGLNSPILIYVQISSAIIITCIICERK